MSRDPSGDMGWVRPEDLRILLEAVSDGRTPIEAALRRLETLPFENLGFASVDHHRALRTGVAEVIYGPGKTPEEIARIVEALFERGQTAMVTRVERPVADQVLRLMKEPAKTAAKYEDVPRLLIAGKEATPGGRGRIAVVSAGTSDRPVAEEAARTAEVLGNRVDRISDVGVAGLHRLLAHRETLEHAEVIIAVAGMEGALPSVVGGLVSRPVIAVPTSIGFGSHFGGLTPLLAMLNSCAAGITVVNIDNGFGAGYAASRINRKREAEAP